MSDDTDFEDIAANQDHYSIFDDDEDVSSKASDHEQKRLYTQRRRKIEDRIEAWKLKDELGIFDDQMYY